MSDEHKYKIHQQNISEPNLITLKKESMPWPDGIFCLHARMVQYTESILINKMKDNIKLPDRLKKMNTFFFFQSKNSS